MHKTTPASIDQSVTLLGVPVDFNSSYLRGAAEAPELLRKAMACDSSNWWTEQGIYLGQEGTFIDAGDVAVSADHTKTLETIEIMARSCLANGRPLITLGGDHSISYPVLRAFNEYHSDLTVIHFDAHPDLYDELLGNRWSHASPFARVMEEKIAKRLIQVGIRTLTGHQYEQAKKFGVEIISMSDLDKFFELEINGPVYISIDLDVLDPAFVPGVSHYEPGGMSVRELIRSLHAINAPVVGADVVEFNPQRDFQGQTAMVGAKLIKELAAKVLIQKVQPAWGKEV
ncbi:agmatinase [Klebsiella pneumoniae]|uniref:agmatinase n=1 Tax=Klebsiella pneumoniae TaxID=573 RepID=UPI00192A76BF|nr:agmatinase [Klebsiella pneumoniae]MBL4514433.1 agmatinase [Klebsiella pneumoniae]